MNIFTNNRRSMTLDTVARVWCLPATYLRRHRCQEKLNAKQNETWTRGMRNTKLFWTARRTQNKLQKKVGVRWNLTGNAELRWRSNQAKTAGNTMGRHRTATPGHQSTRWSLCPRRSTGTNQVDEQKNARYSKKKGTGFGFRFFVFVKYKTWGAKEKVAPQTLGGRTRPWPLLVYLAHKWFTWIEIQFKFHERSENAAAKRVRKHEQNYRRWWCAMQMNWKKQSRSKNLTDEERITSPKEVWWKRDSMQHHEAWVKKSWLLASAKGRRHWEWEEYGGDCQLMRWL